MAEDEIERLLREVAGNTGQSGTTGSTGSGEVAKSADRSPAKADKGGGRMAFAAISAAGFGAAAWFVGLMLPFTSAVSAGIGGAVAAFLTAMVAGPPRWFSS
ncbi:MAG: hypothetical protein Q8M17_09145 [Actinomycetota bacterium]|nr:hypothetical protein [Actinomycetota bacterium]